MFVWKVLVTFFFFIHSLRNFSFFSHSFILSFSHSLFLFLLYYFSLSKIKNRNENAISSGVYVTRPFSSWNFYKFRKHRENYYYYYYFWKTKMPKKKKSKVFCITRKKLTSNVCASRVFVYRCDMSRVCNIYLFDRFVFFETDRSKIVYIEKYSHPNFAQDHKIPFKIHKNTYRVYKRVRLLRVWIDF